MEILNQNGAIMKTQFVGAAHRRAAGSAGPGEAAGVPVSAVVANFNGMDCLPRTIAALKQASRPFAQIIVVDDGSSDGSCEWLAQHHPDVKLIRFEKNTANLGKVRNAGLRAATSDYVFLTDNDIQLQQGAIERLLQTLMADPAAFCVTPRLLDERDPQWICQDGNGLHFLALSTGAVRNRRVGDVGTPAPFPSFGGGIMLLYMPVVRELGCFDEGYVHGWCDDAELQIRGVIAGYKCLHDPAAACLLKLKQHGKGRAFGQLHNRYRLMLTCYSTRTLLALAIAFLVFELMLMAGSCVGGFGRAYFRAWATTWRERHDIQAMRRLVQQRRTIPDHDFLRPGAFELPGGVALPRLALAAIAVVQLVLNANWRAVAPWV